MIFSSGHVRIKDMIIAGITMKIIGIIIILVVSITLIGPIFHVHAVPHIFNSTVMINMTSG